MSLETLQQLAILLLWVAPAVLPFVIHPAGPNRFGAPHETHGFEAAIKSGLSKYFDFKGRASRAEYGWFLLLFGGVYVVAAIVDEAFNSDWFYIAPLLLLVPYVAVSARRLHDINRSGWWQLLVFGAGLFVLFFLLAEPAAQSGTRLSRRPVGGVRMSGNR